MKILLLGDASNYHHTLASGLSKRGHDVIVASNGSRWMDTARDIDISRTPGKLGGAILWLKLNSSLWSRLKGYDIVHLCGVGFLEQKPHRIKSFFDRLRRANGKVYLTALACDPYYVEMCLSKECPFRYNEWRMGGKPTPYAAANPALLESWLAPAISDTTRHIYDNVDGVATALYEYHLSCSRHIDPDRLVYAGIPIDTEALPYIPVPENLDQLRILWAAHKGREAEKGADIMLRQLQLLAGELPERIRLEKVQNLPYNQFQALLDSSQIVVDQLYSYTPATTALMAMAKGKIAVSGAENEFYDFIGENELRPIINADPFSPSDINTEIQRLLDNPNSLRQMSLDSRKFVERHNSVDVVAARFEELWNKTL